MTTKYMYRDDELIDAFDLKGPGKMFRATFIPEGEPNRVDNWELRLFVALNKAEATRIAREYGKRIAHKQMVYVYLADRRW